MNRRTLFLFSGVLITASILLLLLKFILKPDNDLLINITGGVLGMGIVFLLFAVFKKENK